MWRGLGLGTYGRFHLLTKAGSESWSCIRTWLGRKRVQVRARVRARVRAWVRARVRVRIKVRARELLLDARGLALLFERLELLREALLLARLLLQVLLELLRLG